MVKKQNQQAKKKDEKLKKIAKPSPKGKKRDKEPYRCSLHHLCELAVKIKELIKNKQLHLKALKSCPFWRFFEPFYDGVMSKDELIKKTKAVIMFLSTIENRLDGKLPYCFKLARSRKLILRTIPEHFAVTFGFQMVNYVEADDIDEDLVKKTLAAKYLYMVFDMNKVCWPEVFHDYVLDSIMTNRTDVENVVGCVIYPLYWLAEMTKIAQRKHGLDKYPRFARWNLSNICQQVLSNFENLEEKTELWSKENIGHRKGSFLLQYDESEMRLADPVDEVEIVVPDEENEVPVKVQDEENVGASSEANSFKAKYQFARSLIEKLRTNATYVLSEEEEESLLAKYDAEDREQQLVITRDVNMINQQESEQEQVISSSSKTVTDDEQEGDGTELTPNNIEDIKVAKRVESEMEKATSSMPVTNDEQEGEGTELTPNTVEDIKVAERVESEMEKATSSMPITNDEQEGEGTELTPNTIEDIKVAERVESEMSKASSSMPVTNDEQEGEDVIRKMEYEYNKKGCSSSKPNVGSVYYYSAVKMANDLLELENEQPGFDLGLSQCDSQEKGHGELSAAQRMSNMVTRMREDRRNLVPPIRMQDYNTSVKKRRKVTARKCKENKKVQEVQGVKLKPVDNLKILKVLNRNEKPLVTTFFRKYNERSTAWEHLNLQLHISGKMMDNLMREGAGDIIEFYILKLQNNIKKNKLKQDGSPKYQRAVFISTFAYTCHSLGKKCGAVIEGFIDKMDYSVRFLFVPLLTSLGDVNHWILLTFDFETGEFYHYNSLASTGEECRKSAESMKQRIVSSFAQHDAKLPCDQQASQPTTYSLHNPTCCEQIGNDCGLHVCYYMKSLLKGNMSTDDIREKVHNMRPKLALKILLDNIE
ncbi:hypothetical protein C5167_021784 [Papaver somniferum]|uniref:Ubiquitin-like protease family profile domain-containing protein n=1 Tax=Papaver somniferum TaxID=3469 RepID=A0A4Y7JJB2_PAPSO|nr:hypothetical protein C5167_021784 [Papaver somniferum]